MGADEERTAQGRAPVRAAVRVPGRRGLLRPAPTPGGTTPWKRARGRARGRAPPGPAARLRRRWRRGPLAAACAARQGQHPEHERGTAAGTLSARVAVIVRVRPCGRAPRQASGAWRRSSWADLSPPAILAGCDSRGNGRTRAGGLHARAAPPHAARSARPAVERPPSGQGAERGAAAACHREPLQQRVGQV